LWKLKKNEEVALSRHYALFHGKVSKPPMHEAYILQTYLTYF